MTQPPYPSGPPQQRGPGPTGQRPTAGGAWPGQGAYAAGQQGFPPPPPQSPPPPGGNPPPGSGGPGDGRRPPKLPAGVIALIVLAIVVVLGVVGFITFDSLTRDRPDHTAAPSATSAPESSGAGVTPAPSQTASSGSRPDDVQAFDSASGNIHCEIGTNYARCLIDQVAGSFQAPQAPANCSAPNYGRVAVATPSQVGYECSEASMPTGGAKLAYGKSIEKTGMKCTSTESGMECHATSGGKGFKIARAGITWAK